MFLYIENKNNKPILYFKSNLAKWARITIGLYKFKATEKILDEYFKEHLNISLRTLCIFLVHNASLNTTQDKNISVSFKEKDHDSLARLITFGNGTMQGSRILIDAFTPIN